MIIGALKGASLYFLRISSEIFGNVLPYFSNIVESLFKESPVTSINLEGLNHA